MEIPSPPSLSNLAGSRRPQSEPAHRGELNLDTRSVEFVGFSAIFYRDAKLDETSRIFADLF